MTVATSASQVDNSTEPDTPPAALSRLATLLRLAEGAWALAVFENETIRRAVTAQLRAALAPLPVIEVPLVGQVPDPLAILQSPDLSPDHPAPVVVFTGVGSAFPDLFGYLDLQRESLARLPHRLLFWVTEYERRALAERAPNFYTRLSGVFRFPGTTVSALTVGGGSPHLTAPESPSRLGRRRPSLQVRDEADRPKLIAQQLRRIHKLRAMIRPDARAIADSWYDLGGLFEGAPRPQWREAEAAYSEAARAYSEAQQIAWQAEALALAGEAARRGYDHRGALDYLQRALTLYRLLDDGLTRSPQMALGEANVLQAQGDVLAFQDRREEALARYQAALELYRAVGARLGEANVLLEMGDLLRKQALYEQSWHLYEQARERYTEISDRYSLARVLYRMGDWYGEQNSRSEAAELYRRAIALWRAMGFDNLANDILLPRLSRVVDGEP